MSVANSIRDFFKAIKTTFITNDEARLKRMIEEERADGKKLTDFVSLFTQLIFLTIFTNISGNLGKSSSGTLDQYYFLLCLVGGTILQCYFYFIIGKIIFYSMMKSFALNKNIKLRLFTTLTCIMIYWAAFTGIQKICELIADSAMKNYIS